MLPNNLPIESQLKLANQKLDFLKKQKQTEINTYKTKYENL
jgi:hypothetical protein